jgi:hypothetical protein
VVLAAAGGMSLLVTVKLIQGFMAEKKRTEFS